MRQFIETAVDHIARFGDTDIFPYPIEHSLFFDERDKVVDLVEQIHKDFDNQLKQFPPLTENAIAASGYTGFRWATQIDPIWDAYFLALTISIGNDIEKARIPVDRATVFSYRFTPNATEKTLFSKAIGYSQFQDHSVHLAKAHTHVLRCDISDFYPRIYNHRLENALLKATSNKQSVERIKKLMYKFSKGVSYGLPVGGNAARLLAELLLNRTDRLLQTDRIVFCRFVDDYHIFADSREEAYEHLVFLNKKLLENEGLSLQKHKTQISTREEFLNTMKYQQNETPTEGADGSEIQRFLRLQLHFDPYSATAQQDYESLQGELQKFDIVGMLSRELTKSRINSGLTKRLITAVRHVDPKLREGAVSSLLENLEVLYPVFPNVMLLMRGVLPELPETTRMAAFSQIRGLIARGSYITRVTVNLAYAIRVLALDPSVETDETLAQIYATSDSLLIRRDTILIMARRNCDFWISDLKLRYHSLAGWEQRSMLVASYILGDEGGYWRGPIKKELDSVSELLCEWVETKQKSSGWEIPI